MLAGKWGWQVPLGLALVSAAAAGTPDWFGEAARTPTLAYPEETSAVVLLSEHATTVKDSGEIDAVYRRVVELLRPQGRDEALVVVFSDSETRIASLKAGGLTPEVRNSK